jgi:hypothetical protein
MDYYNQVHSYNCGYGSNRRAIVMDRPTSTVGSSDRRACASITALSFRIRRHDRWSKQNLMRWVLSSWIVIGDRLLFPRWLGFQLKSDRLGTRSERLCAFLGTVISLANSINLSRYAFKPSSRFWKVARKQKTLDIASKISPCSSISTKLNNVIVGKNKII